MINIYGKILPILRKCMRISTIILSIQICCTSLLLAKHTRAQEMNLNVVNASVKQVFKHIEQQASVTFVYDEQVINHLPALTLHISKQQLPEVLKQLQDKTLLQFKMVGSYIGVAKNAAGMPALLISSADKSNTAKIAGTVRDASGQILIGVNITIRGTQGGTQTDVNGKFSIDANLGDVLVFSYVGYIKKEITITTPASLNVLLDEDSKQLGEIVVTALGIKKERKALGYSVTEIKGDELTQAREPNLMNGLEGKVAGLNASAGAGGVGASTNIIIRGVSGLGINNASLTQPLYVINGIPMQNPINATAGSQYDNSPDLGDAIGNLNPDDIESISVLKGAAASALYGNRGKSGVIVITTKSGKGNGIDLNSNYVFEQVMDPTHWQYAYGQGGTGSKPVDAAGASQTGQSSYGALLDGSNVVQFDGVSRPYIAQNNNIKHFYNTGGTATNTIAFNKSFDAGSVRFSASDLANRAITPNSGLNRQSFDLNGNYSLSKNFIATAHVNYILEQAHNRPFLSDGPGNSNFNVTLLPTSVDVNTLQKAVNTDGSEYAYSGNAYATNPWFAAEKFINNTNRSRVIASTTLRYNFDNGYFVQGRAGRDAFNDRYTGIIPTGTAYRPLGAITEQTSTTSDLSVDALLGKTFKVNSDITITPNIGASYRRQKTEQFILNGSDFIVPYTYNITNALKQQTPAFNPSDNETQSAYGTLELGYKGYLYLNGSARADWFSTLAAPGFNNKLYTFYPSVSGSFVFSELIKYDWLSFGKVRAGYANVGQATDPYQTQLAYTFNAASLNKSPLGLIANLFVPNSSLIPSSATELEIGTEMKLFKNRLGIDLTWYNKNSKNEILPAPASVTSGYGGAILNIGQVQNKGIEILLTSSPVKTNAFTWNISLNAAMNNNTVVSLAAGQLSLPVAVSRTGNGFTQQIVGLPAYQVMAFDYKYDASGNIVKDAASGIPVSGDLKAYGSAYAKWTGGITDEFSYKRFNLSFLIDAKFGSKIFSATDYYAYVLGLHQATLVNRDGLGNKAANYYSTLANNVSGLFVQDASFIKFRQVTFGYNFPAKLFNNIIKGANLSFVGRNLFYIKKHTDNIDPESDYSYNAQGLELGGVPPSRTFGLNLSVKL